MAVSGVFRLTSKLFQRRLHTFNVNFKQSTNESQDKIDPLDNETPTNVFIPPKVEQLYHDNQYRILEGPKWDTTDPYNYEWFRDTVNKHKTVVFMKGTPDHPLCVFSDRVVYIMKVHGVDFTNFNVLSDPNLREGVKRFTQWPCIPQVFLSGDFIGGSDVLSHMHATGDLVIKLHTNGINSRLLEGPLRNKESLKLPEGFV